MFISLSHQFPTMATQSWLQPRQQAILNPHAIPMQSWNPTATQAEDLAEG